MKVTYEKDTDSLYIYLVPEIKEKEVAKTIKISDDVFVDCDKKGKALGIEILYAFATYGEQIKKLELIEE
jgi:uncharacterized protein YuzE